MTDFDNEAIIEATNQTVRQHDAKVREASQSVRHAINEISRVETPFTIVGHIIDADPIAGTYTGRLVLKGGDSFYAAVLAVGKPSNNYHAAIANAVEQWVEQLREGDPK